MDTRSERQSNTFCGESPQKSRTLTQNGECFMATHQMDFARALATEIIFMEHGRLIEQGAPDVLLAEGSNTRTRDFCQRLLEMGA